jgi:hypothetical protein
MNQKTRRLPMNVKGVIGIILLCLLMPTGARSGEPLKDLRDPVKIFEEGYIQVVGVSEQGQSRAHALRAAEIVAKRDLLEIVQGLHLYGNTKVQDGVLQSDTIRTTVKGFLWGAVKCGEKFDPDKGYAEVCVRLNIRGKDGLYGNLWPLLRDKHLWPGQGSAYEPPETARLGDLASESGARKDGLIVDVRDFPFRPALVNRVITKNNAIVFDPSKIVTKILVERGCGGYTTDPKKAKAMLEYWGSERPMTVKCIGVNEMTDARVSAEDAEAIFFQDQRSAMLGQARLVFLLK